MTRYLILRDAWLAANRKGEYWRGLRYYTLMMSWSAHMVETGRWSFE